MEIAVCVNLMSNQYERSIPSQSDLSREGSTSRVTNQFSPSSSSRFCVFWGQQGTFHKKRSLIFISWTWDLMVSVKSSSLVEGNSWRFPSRVMRLAVLSCTLPHSFTKVYLKQLRFPDTCSFNKSLFVFLNLLLSSLIVNPFCCRVCACWKLSSRSCSSLWWLRELQPGPLFGLEAGHAGLQRQPALKPVLLEYNFFAGDMGSFGIMPICNF